MSSFEESILRFALVLLVLWPLSAEAQDQVMHVHYSTRDQQLARYVYVPFDVPAGTARITIAYDFDRSGDANVIDLGLFEPGPLTTGSRAFRGWSGGARTTATVGMTDASPGYWCGPIPPGRWHVAFGLYKVARAGVDVEIRVSLSEKQGTGTCAAPDAALVEPAGSDRPGWYVGALHAHTTHSDGALSPSQLIDKAAADGLDFLAITDHNNTTHRQALPWQPALVVISGEEVTTPVGHFNVWGLNGRGSEVDFRMTAGGPTAAQLMNSTGEAAVIGINHPTADCVACAWTTILFRC